MLAGWCGIRLLRMGLLVLTAGAAWGQDYPIRPIRVITGAAAGGADFVARLVGPGLTDSLGQPVIIDNRGNGAIPGQIMVRALPDGYTLLINGSNIWLLPFLQDDVPYDPVRDFSPITMAASLPSILVVNPMLPAKSVKELIALAKARPGELNYASGPAGSANHLGAELFKSMAGVNLVRIPYKGTAPAVADLIGAQVQVMFANAATVIPSVKSGRLRALAIGSARPSEIVPGLPTVAAAGLPGYESATTVAVFAPAHTAPALINRLNREIVRVLNRTDVKETFFNAGAEVVGGSPPQLAATIKSDMLKMGKLIREAGIRGE